MPFKTVEEAAAYLAGMIDGEGTIGSGGKNNIQSRRIKIANTDRVLLATCGECCEMLGIAYRIEVRKPVEGREHWSQGYDLAIYGKENFERVLDLVPIQSEAKRAALTLILGSYTRKPIPSSEELQRLHDSGMSHTDLMEYYGVKSTGTISYWLRTRGIKRRGHSEATRRGWEKRRRNKKS